MGHPDLEKGIFKAACVVEQAFDTIEQDFAALAERLSDELEPDSRIKFNRVAEGGIKHIISRRRFSTPQFKAGGVHYCIFCDVVLGENCRFSQTLQRPFMIWQIQYGTKIIGRENPFCYSQLPVCDSEEEGMEPSCWRGRSDNEKIFFFEKQGDYAKVSYLIFLTPVLSQDSSQSRLADNNFFEFFCGMLQSRAPDRRLPQHYREKMEQNGIVLSWDSEGEVLNPLLP